jgi:hypothetical protein
VAHNTSEPSIACASLAKKTNDFVGAASRRAPVRITQCRSAAIVETSWIGALLKQHSHDFGVPPSGCEHQSRLTTVHDRQRGVAATVLHVWRCLFVGLRGPSVEQVPHAPDASP